MLFNDVQDLSHRKPDLRSEDDVKQVVTAFYTHLGDDPVFSGLLTKVKAEYQIPMMCEFWMTLLYKPGQFHPMAFLKSLLPGMLTKEHFLNWMKIFNETLDCFFEGPNVMTLKKRVKEMVEAY